MAAALFSCRDLRVDAGGVPACDGLTLGTRAQRGLVLGAPQALFLAAIGLAPVVRGALAIREHTPVAAAQQRLVAGAPKDTPLPPKWSVVDYVTWSARLAGVANPAHAAADAIDRLKLGALAKAPSKKLVPHARRAVVVAAALATGAEALLLEDPLGGLADDAAALYGELLAAALADRSWLVFAPRMPLGAPLVAMAEEAIVIGGAASERVDAQGAPHELAGASRRYIARLEGGTEAVITAVAEQGGTVSTHGGHVLVELGPTLTTAGLFAICAEADVAVLELVPAVHAFA